jgi:hypothetical protein
MRIELDRLGLAHHLLDPDQVLETLLADTLDRGFHLGQDFLGIGCAGAEDDLHVGVDVLDGIDQVDDAFLTRDAADEEDNGLARVDAVFFEGSRFRSLDGTGRR